MSDLKDMPNIGRTLADRMQAAGITTSDDLKTIGSKEAFIKVLSVFPEACINQLYAMEGAIQNIRWHHLPDESKANLKDFYNSL